MQTRKSCKEESYSKDRYVAPTPLFGELRDPEPIPLTALGRLADVINAISTLTQAPPEIAMQSVLGVASTSVQGLCDVETLNGYVPLSLFLVTVAKSGERKSACDALATRALRRRDQKNDRKYRKEKRAFEAEISAYMKGKRCNQSKETSVIDDGERDAEKTLQPEPPLIPNILISDLTIEGLIKRFEKGTPSIVVMMDEGGQFFGGYSMKRENLLNTAAALSKLWDGSPIVKSRASSEFVTLYGKRLTLHLMIQPGVAQNLVGNATLKDQGLLSRILLAWPKSRIGKRFLEPSVLREAEEENARATINDFDACITQLLELDLPVLTDTRADLDPRQLDLSSEAKECLRSFYNRVERACDVGEAFEYIAGFAAKAPEMAARIAGVLSLFDDKNVEEISLVQMRDGVALIEWYLGEMLRISDTGCPDQELQEAEQLRQWLLSSWEEDCIDKRNIMKRGPGHLRDGATVTRCVKKLEEHGFLLKGDGRQAQTIGGVRSKTFWWVGRSETKA